jgi:hypothetical protein
MERALNEYLVHFFREAVKCADVEPIEVARDALMDMLIKVRTRRLPQSRIFSNL